MSIATQLVEVNDTKLAIKASIIGKGVDLTGIPFTEYPEAIDSISGSTPVAEWERPADWLTLPAVTGNVMLSGLVAVYDTDSEFVTLKFTGNGSAQYTVNWGDGSTPEAVTYGTKVTHNYDYADLAGSESTRGYRQALITVEHSGTPSDCTGAYLQELVDNVIIVYRWLDLHIAHTPLTVLNLTNDEAFSGEAFWTMLEQIRIGSNSVTNFSQAFYYCINVQSIPEFYCASATSIASAFSGCRLLKQAPSINAPAATAISQLFQNCISLVSSPAITFGAGVTDTSSMFASCVSLKTVTLFDTSGVTNFGAMFSSCSELRSVPDFDTSSATNMAGMFISCTNLLEAPNLDTSSVTSMNTMHQNNTRLTTFPSYSFASVLTASSTFNSCTSLREVPNLSLPVATTLSSMFANCSGLVKMGTISVPSATNVQSMFSGANSLASLPTINMASITNGSNYANGTSCLTTLTLPGLRYATSVFRTRLSAASLNALFTSLGTAAGAQVITITSTPGAATCDRTIATAKGWTVTG